MFAPTRPPTAPPRAATPRVSRRPPAIRAGAPSALARAVAPSPAGVRGIVAHRLGTPRPLGVPARLSPPRPARRPPTSPPPPRGAYHPAFQTSAVASTAAAAASTTLPEAACVVSLGYVVASYVAFWLGARAPDSRCGRFTRSALPLAPLCVAYLALLVASWSPDTLALMMPGSLEAGLSGGGFNPQFFPKLEGIVTLLSRRAVAASAWLHVACVNYFVGRHAATRAAEGGWPVAHTLVLSLFFGPIGLCSHWATKWLARTGRIATRPRPETSSREAKSEMAAATTGEVADEVKLDVDALAAQTEGDARRDAGRAYGERAYGFAYGFAYGGAVPKKRSTKHRFALLSTLM